MNWDGLAEMGLSSALSASLMRRFGEKQRRGFQRSVKSRLELERSASQACLRRNTQLVRCSSRCRGAGRVLAESCLEVRAFTCTCVLDKAPPYQHPPSRSCTHIEGNQSRAFTNTPSAAPASQLHCLEHVYFPHYSWFSCMLPRPPLL